MSIHAAATVTALSTDPEQALAAYAERAGLRVEWSECSWETYGRMLTSVCLYRGGQWVVGGSSTWKSSAEQKQSRQFLAKMVLDSLPSRGAGRTIDRLAS